MLFRSPTRTPKPKPAALSISVASQRVSVGSSVGVSGQLTTNSGQPVPGRRVWLAQRLTGQQTWQRVASGLTDESGTVSLSTASLDHNVLVRLGFAGRFHSGAVRVVILPRIYISTTPDGQQYDVTATADGAQVGDTVIVQRRQQGQWNQVQSAVISNSGSAYFGVGTPRRGTVRNRVVLRATNSHGYAQAGFAVSAQ